MKIISFHGSYTRARSSVGIVSFFFFFSFYSPRDTSPPSPISDRRAIGTFPSRFRGIARSNANDRLLLVENSFHVVPFTGIAFHRSEPVYIYTFRSRRDRAPDRPWMIHVCTGLDNLHITTRWLIRWLESRREFFLFFFFFSVSLSFNLGTRPVPFRRAIGRVRVSDLRGCR